MKHGANTLAYDTCMKYVKKCSSLRIKMARFVQQDVRKIKQLQTSLFIKVNTIIEVELTFLTVVITLAG